MANEEHLAILLQGADAWNAWRREHSDVREPDLSAAILGEADLRGADLGEADLRKADLHRADLRAAILFEAKLAEADLRGADLRGANLGMANLVRANLAGADLRKVVLGTAFLYQANLSGADLGKAKLGRAFLSRTNLSGASLYKANLYKVELGWSDLRSANLRKASFHEANLGEADLRGADLRKADLRGANLLWANLAGADLRGAKLLRAALVETNLAGADLTGCRIYGLSAWRLNLDRTKQKDLIITKRSEPEVTVDNLEVAQFIYLLLHNEKIRDVIDTITSKAALILGRFTPERKAVLDALREELRRRGYVPILFDFDKPASKDLTGTVQTLANMARFVIADLTDPSCIPHELAMVVPGTVVPVQPVLLEGQPEYAMFVDLRRRYGWVLEPYRYHSPELLIDALGERVIAPAEAKARELRAVPPPAG